MLIRCLATETRFGIGFAKKTIALTSARYNIGDSSIVKNENGFSLIELLIVVVIIGILAAIAIPNLLSARRASNEGSAISALRTIHSAQVTYHATTGAGSYAGNATFMDTSGMTSLMTANLIDSSLGSGTKSGYGFWTGARPGTATSPATFWASTAPVVASGVSQTGTRRFGIVAEGMIYWRTDFLGNAQIDDADIRLGTPLGQ